MESIELEHGTTAYERAGPDAGRAIVLVHGLTTPSFVWDATFAELARDHHVVRYDLLGRGASARPEITYDVEVYVAQLDALVAHTCPGELITLVAYSWGAGLASLWAARNATRVEGLVLVAPGGLEPSFALDALATVGPLVARSRALVRRMLARDLERCFVAPGAQRAYFARFFEQLERPGFEHAFLSTIRHVPSALGGYYAGLAGGQFPVDVLWGTRDQKVPIGLFARLGALVPHARLHPVEGGAHAMMAEHPERFNHALGAVLERGPTP